MQQRLRGWAVWLSFLIFLVLPLYLLSAVMAIRSGLVTFDGTPPAGDQAKALWAFIGSGLAASGTVLAALLTKSHNDRTYALAARDSARMSLDTAVVGLNLIRHENHYSPPAVVAGGLVTLIHLGHPTIAMRALSAAWEDRAVDRWTVCWIIGQVLTSTGVEESTSPLLKVEASSILLLNADQFTANISSVGKVPWPDCLTASWPRHLPEVAAANCIAALVVVVTSQPKAWWHKDDKTWTWAIYSLVEALEDDSDAVRDMAARVVLEMLKSMDEDERIVGLSRALSKAEAATKASARIGVPFFRTGHFLERLQNWAGR